MEIMSEIIPIQIIENKIFLVRGHKVMLDSDLAQLYEVKTFNLNKAVKRNPDRFPEDFMFQITDREWEILRFQIGISKEAKGGRRYNPYVFTEQGVAMLSSVLSSKRAIAVNVQIMRTFVKIREITSSHKEITQRLDDLERTFINYAREANVEIEDIFTQLRHLTDITKPSKIGY